ncbi:hypothetical protein DP20_3293 [Shigella flexneri]|nr:hypothetical protein DP20_3293 [Shigella flexneri]
MHSSLISPASCRFCRDCSCHLFYLLLMLFRGLLQNCRNRLDGLPLLTSVWV